MNCTDQHSAPQRIDPLQCGAWDAFVAAHPAGLVYHLSDWKRVLEAAFPHIRAHYLILRSDTGDIRAGLPVFEVRSWLTGSRLVSIPFATLSHPLVQDAVDTGLLVEGAIQLQSELNCPDLEIRALERTGLEEDVRLSCSAGFVHHFIELDADPDEIKRRFHRTSVRQTIHRAMRSGLVVREGETIDDVDLFFALYAHTRRRLGLPCQPRAFFHAIWNRFGSQGRTRFLIAEDEGSPAAALLCFAFNGRVSAEYEGYDPSYNASRPNHLIFWEAIRRSCEERFRIFDFGRTSMLNTGLLAFKRRWGTIEVELPTFHHPRRQRWLNRRDGDPAYRVAQTLFKRCPQWLYSPLSRQCYRHLG